MQRFLILILLALSLYSRDLVQTFSFIAKDLKDLEKFQMPMNETYKAEINEDNSLEFKLIGFQQRELDAKKWLFVVGIENYKFTDNIIYAKKSAEIFTHVAQKALGVPKQNTYLLLDENATSSQIKVKLKLLARNIKEGDTVYFYYNGHGIPVPNQENEPFILSSDMMPDFVGEEKDLMLKQIYQNLSNTKAGSIIAFVDSCFTGTTDAKSVFSGVAATKMKPKGVEFDKSKMVVITAGKDNQFSNAYVQKSYRLFSYFVMYELLNGEKDIKRLFDNVYLNTKETTMRNYGDMRLQEPQIEGNEKIKL